MSTTVEPPSQNGRAEAPTRPADLLRSVKTRQSGTRPWVWYSGIGIIAMFLAFLVVQAATNTGPPGAARRYGATATTTDPEDIARDKWRYSGKAVDHSTDLTMRDGARSHASVVPAPSGSAAPGGPATGTPGAAASAAPVPDVSGSHWSYQRYPLPTPAPEDGQQRVPDPQQFRAASGSAGGMTVVYGAPAQAGGAVAAATNAAQSAYEAAAAYARASAPTSNPHAQTAASQAAPQGSDAAAPSTYGGQPNPYQVSSGEDAPPPRGAAPVANPPPRGGLGDSTQRAETMPSYRRPPSARLMVPGGTWIAAQLDEDVQSDVAGPVDAHVASDVVDPLSGEVLIPRGTRIIGEYTGLKGGQSRLSFMWKRLLFPDLSSFALDNVGAMDENGHAGLGGRVDDHRGPVFRRTFLGGLLAEIGNRLTGTTNGGQNVVIFNSTGVQQPGLPQAILDLANRLNNQDLNYPPTVTIEHNTLFSLYVDRDMLFDAPYAPMRVK